MTASPSANSPTRFAPAVIAIAVGALILSVSTGVRQTFGLFVAPFSTDYGVPVTQIAFAIALHNLVWGVAQPIVGAVADRRGPAPLIALGATTYALGLIVSALAPSGPALIFGMGILVGVGISCTSFGVIFAAVGRAAPPHKRSMALGLASAGGSLGQVVLVPLAQGLNSSAGTAVSLMVLAACILAVAPLGFLMRGTSGDVAGEAASWIKDLRKALSEALGHSGYRLLTLGFFTCGFQLAFIATHLPTYLTLCHMPGALSATALAVIGLFNIIGSWACGGLGARFPQQHVLGWLYLLRGAAVAVFFIAPKSEASVLIFAAVMGLAWLGTLPLTSGLVAKVFGVRHLGTLFGVCFLSHQIGAFLGAWLGGYVFDATGSYALVWTATAILGVVAALLHFPIRDTPFRPSALPA